MLPILGFIFMIFFSKILSTITISFLIHSMFYIIPYCIAVYFLYKFKDKDLNHVISTESLKNFQFKRPFLYTFLIMYMLSIIYLNLVTEREILLIVFLTILYFIIFLQIILTDTHPGIILSELISTFIISVFSITLRYPYYFGNTDVFIHVDWATIVYETGRLLPPELLSPYTHYPISQLFTVIGANLFNTSVLLSNHLVLGLIFSLSIVFIYIIFEHFFERRTVLLACLFYTVTGLIIKCGLRPIPYVIAFIFFILLFFFILKINIQRTYRFHYLLLSILIMIVLVLSHHASPVMILGLFITYYIILTLLQYLTNDKKIFNPVMIVSLLIFFLFYWYYVARDYSVTLEMAVRHLLFEGISIDTISTPIKIIYEGGILQENIEFLLKNLPSCILVIFLIIGIGFMIKHTYQKYLWGFTIFAFINIMVWVPIGSRFLNFFSLLAFDRLLLYTTPFVMIIFAFAFYKILKNKYKSDKKYILLILSILVIVYSFMSLISVSHLNFGSGHLIVEFSPYFNNDDVTSINFFDTYTQNNAIIKSDLFPYRYFYSKQESEVIKDLNWHYYRIQMLDWIGSPGDEDTYIFYRKGEFEKTTFLLTDSNQLLYKDHETVERTFLSTNEIFNTGKNEIFLNH